MNCQTFKDTNPEDKELRWLFRNNNIFFFFFFLGEKLDISDVMTTIVTFI